MIARVKNQISRLFTVPYFSVKSSRSIAWLCVWTPTPAPSGHKKPRWPPVPLSSRSWRSFPTILRNKRGMWTVYQTGDMCLREYDLCNKFADNKMLLLLFKKCWTMFHALKLPCWKVKRWAIQLTFAQCEKRRVLFRLTNSKKFAVCWVIKTLPKKREKRERV